MASFTIADDELGPRGQALVADTVDTITYLRNAGEVEVQCVEPDGSESDILFTVDGSTPSAASKKTYRVTGFKGAAHSVETPSGDTVVKVWSAGTPSYDVTGGL